MGIKNKAYRTVALGLCMGVVLCTASGCGTEKTAIEVPELIEPVGVDVDTAEVTKMDLSSVTSYEGDVVPETKEVYFLSDGQAGAVKVEIGDVVKKGQLLATLSGADSTLKELRQDLKDQIAEDKEVNATKRSDIKQLQIQYKEILAQIKEASSKKEKNSLNKQKIEKSEAIKTAKLELKMQKESQSLYIKELKEDIQDAKKQAKLSKLYSPVNGEVITKDLAPGDFVSAGNTVITIADMDQTMIRTEYIGSSVMAKASSYVATINGRKYEVTAEEQTVSQYDIEMGNYPSSTYFTYDKDDNVSVGDSVTIDFYYNATEDALVIPTNALYRDSGERYVYRMNGDAKEKVTVTTGTSTDAYTQILTGLEEGDVVYVPD